MADHFSSNRNAEAQRGKTLRGLILPILDSCTHFSHQLSEATARNLVMTLSYAA